VYEEVIHLEYAILQDSYKQDVFEEEKSDNA
jgi:hypothetical protein